MDYNDRNNPLHVAATSTNETTDQIVKLLVEAYVEEFIDGIKHDPNSLPWFEKNKEDQGLLHLAILNRRDSLALYISSVYFRFYIEALLNYYEPEHTILFLAMRNNCYQVAKYILERLREEGCTKYGTDERLRKESCTKYLTDPSNGQTILHLAPDIPPADQDFGRWLVVEFPEFMARKDNTETSPLDKAVDFGAAWFVQAFMSNYPSALQEAPLAWVKACNHDRISTLHAFIDHNPGQFRDFCIIQRDSPLHHIQLPSLTDYEEFFKIPRMKDLINLQNSQGSTPLHIAIQRDDLFLAETLLSMDKTKYNIKDKDKNTAIDLLALKCQQRKWDEMCKRFGFDPKVETADFQHKKHWLLELRNTLSVVAALQATITFTAGFTLPGGLKQETGEAMFARKAAFNVFLISDAVALCCSMLVLICFLRFPLHDSSASSVLMFRMQTMLLTSLYTTVVAFMCGVYLVISPKSLWAAIFTIIICSLICIALNKTCLYKVLYIPSTNEEQWDNDRMSQLEQGISANEHDHSL